MATFGTCLRKRLGDGVFMFWNKDKAWIEITIGRKTITRKANRGMIRRMDGRIKTNDSNTNA